MRDELLQWMDLSFLLLIFQNILWYYKQVKVEALGMWVIGITIGPIFSPEEPLDIQRMLTHLELLVANEDKFHILLKYHEAKYK